VVAAAAVVAQRALLVRSPGMVAAMVVLVVLVAVALAVTLVMVVLVVLALVVVVALADVSAQAAITRMLAGAGLDFLDKAQTEPLA